MKFETVKAREPGEWRVEAIDREGDGEAYIAIFAGPGAKERAEEYANWKNRSQSNSPGQRIADAVERWARLWSHSTNGEAIDHAKAALAREIDAALKATAASVHLDDLV